MIVITIYNTESETLTNHDRKLQPDFRIETEAILPSSSDMMELNVFSIALPFYDLQYFGKNLTLQSE